MKKSIIDLSIALTLFLCGASISWACTDVRLTAQDGTVLVARSMEFAIDLKSNLMSSPREKEFKQTAPNGKPGLSWTAKYGYVFLDGFNLGVPLDGINEEGLSLEMLLFPGEAKYQVVPGGREQQALSYVNFGDWILGNFKNVDEVRNAVKNVYVFEEKLPALNDEVFPVHFSIYDISGKGIVIEYVDGKLQVYDNIGVMTNSPTYDWHTTNLRNYLNLSPANPKPIIDNGITYSATGQGAGMLGLPGDISPPSRFVKMAILSKVAFQPKDATEALNLGQHLLNNVDIPLGLVREAQKDNVATNELTQWVVFKDLTHRKIYYRTYQDLSLRSVDLSKIDFSPEAPQLKMPIASEQYVIDMTSEFIGEKK